MLEDLASHGYIERRQSPRKKISLKATAQSEASRESASVHLRDLSTGGFCMFTPEAASTGERYRVTLDDPDGNGIAILARVQWCQQTEEGYLIGCAFLEEGAHLQVERALASHSHEEADTSGFMKTASQWCKSVEADLVGATVAATRVPDLLTIDEAASRAYSILSVAVVGATASFLLCELSAAAGPVSWTSAVVALLVAVLWGVRFQAVTREVLGRAATEQSESGPESPNDHEQGRLQDLKHHLQRHSKQREIALREG